MVKKDPKRPESLVKTMKRFLQTDPKEVEALEKKEIGKKKAKAKASKKP